jgi:hypothetical protein
MTEVKIARVTCVVTITLRGQKSLWSDWFQKLGAEGGTRTPTGCPIRPSNVRVYQFHHFGLFVRLYKDLTDDRIIRARLQRYCFLPGSGFAAFFDSAGLVCLFAFESAGFAGTAPG